MLFSLSRFLGENDSFWINIATLVRFGELLLRIIFNHISHLPHLCFLAGSSSPGMLIYIFL